MLTIYILSTFVSNIVGEQLIGILFVIFNLILLVLINLLPNVLARNGVLPMSLFFLILNGISLLFMGYSQFTPLIILAFSIHNIVTVLTWITFDILLERNTINRLTGNTRGLYYTIGSLGSIITPAFSGLLYDRYGLPVIFLLSALILIPVIILLLRHFKLHDPLLIKKHFNFHSAVKKTWDDLGLRNIFILSTIVNFFYAAMVIYMPIYLHNDIGLSWSSIGIIFTIMLLPFAIFSYPAGNLGDKTHQEKWILSVGLVIMAIFTAALSFVHGNNVILWVALLFMTRVGTALADESIEGYFFKKVNATDVDLINLFRNAGVIANIIGPATITLLLFFMPLKFIFIPVALIILSGLIFSLRLKKVI